MSTLAIDNFKPSAGGTSFGIAGIAKAWGEYNNSTSALGENLNVSSITDNGTGKTDLNFTNAFATATYGATGVAGNTAGGAGAIIA